MQLTEMRAIDGNDGSPMVSVIMPAYQVSQYIAAAIESILNQTFTSYEILVVNDGSPDTQELERVLEPYRERITYIKQSNGGCSAARNAAIRVSRGRYIALLDADDIWEPNYLATHVGILESDTTLDVIYPNATIFGDQPDSGKLFMDCFPSEGEVTIESLIRQKCIVMISVTARREAIVRAGLFDESLRSSEDFDMWLRILEHGGRIGYHRQAVVRYRRRRESLSANPIGMCRHIVAVLDNAEKRGRLSRVELEALKEQRARFHAMLRLYEGKKAFFDGEAAKAFDCVAEANSYFRSIKLRLVLVLLRAAPHLLLRAYNLRDRLTVGMSTRF
jgi:glycosyltransferase involved in cell wall biosynthesis